ncbi:hypothetical protein HN935_02055 [archaeon]|jgi:type II secretory pathway pseudopilin PulG|nr:hypothetical protein [archaeon]
MKRMNKKGQIWVETVIYTLIGLAVIGLVLAVALPKINEKKDEVAIDQAVEALGHIDDKIYEVQRATGNKRVVDLDIGKGYVLVDMVNNTIAWILDSSFEYSEKDMVVPLGRLNVTTTAGNPWKVELKLGYAMDIKYKGDDFGTHQLDVAPTPYKFSIENKGKEDGNIVIDLSES